MTPGSRQRVLLATSPFGVIGDEPLTLLRDAGIDLSINPFGRRLKGGEVSELVRDVDAVIAGTEPYTDETLRHADRLRLIARVGIGLDNVDLRFCRSNGILVSYTPDGPSQAVAELTIGNMLNLLRHITESDRSVREGAWNRLMGRLLQEMTVGIVGLGRIGKIVSRILQPFQTRVLACDSQPDVAFARTHSVDVVDIDRIQTECDIITFHIPGSDANHHLIDAAFLEHCKEGVMIINTSRGSILDEAALLTGLSSGRIAGAALDVFDQEPYEGPLIGLANVVLTAHIGASAAKSRLDMELQAAREVVRVLRGAEPEQQAFEA